MSQPIIKVACVANLYTREMKFEKAGDTELGHKHPFNHITFLSSGKLKVETELGISEFTAPHMIYIHKDYLHELTALEDDTVAYCIHALRNGDGVDDIIDEDMIPKGINVSEIFEIAKHVNIG
jgi:quercetin dioxygenase-like cupin family protein